MSNENIKNAASQEEIEVKREHKDDINVDDTRVSFGATENENNKLKEIYENVDRIIQFKEEVQNFTDECDVKIEIEENDINQLCYQKCIPCGISPLPVNEDVNGVKVQIDIDICNLRNQIDFKHNKHDIQTIETDNNKYKMNRHLTVHDDAQPYKCTLCDKGFKRKDVFKRHSLVHTPKKKFECAYCDFKSNYKADFKMHWKEKHLGKREYKCSICSYETNKGDRLRMHIKTHSLVQTKKFKCPHCPFQADFESILKRHIYVHDNKKPYVCNKCEQSFIQKVQLQQHIGNKHIDDKKYSCLKCNYKSNNKYHFKEHVFTHNDSKPYKCNVCSKQFKRNDKLKRHAFTHSKEKRFDCEYCTYKSNYNVHLKRHLKNKHKQV